MFSISRRQECRKQEKNYLCGFRMLECSCTKVNDLYWSGEYRVIKIHSAVSLIMESLLQLSKQSILF